MKLRGSAWPLGLALIWNWSLQSMILIHDIDPWYWSHIDLILIWYRSGIDLVLVWYWSWYWSDIDLDIDLILVRFWKMDQSSGLKKPAFTIDKNQVQYYWSGLIRIYFFWMPDPHGTSQYNFVLFETLFRAKGLRATLENRNLTSVFDDRASFRAKTFLRRTLLKIEIFLIFWRSNLPNRSG